MNYYEVNWGDDLTGLNTPCILYIRNSNEFYWYRGWEPTKEKIPTGIGRYFRLKDQELKK